MDTVVPFLPAADPTDDALDEALVGGLAEVDAAIALVVGRAAVRVRLTGLVRADAIAATAAAHAQSAGVRFRLDRNASSGPATITVGPIG